MTLGYDHLSVDEALRKLLPKDIEDIPSSYEQIGHIAHLNLREVISSHRLQRCIQLILRTGGGQTNGYSVAKFVTISSGPTRAIVIAVFL